MNNNKENLLFISSHLPSNIVPQAGHKIAYKNLIEYTKRYNVYLISFFNKQEAKYIRTTDFGICIEKHFYYREK